MKNKAQQVLAQIRKHYTYNGYVQINHTDLQKHIRDNMIDVTVKSVHKHSGYDCSFDSTMYAFHYSDGSILIINSNGTLSASK